MRMGSFLPILGTDFPREQRAFPVACCTVRMEIVVRAQRCGLFLGAFEFRAGGKRKGLKFMFSATTTTRTTTTTVHPSSMDHDPRPPIFRGPSPLENKISTLCEDEGV